MDPKFREYIGHHAALPLEGMMSLDEWASTGSGLLKQCRVSEHCTEQRLDGILVRSKVGEFTGLQDAGLDVDLLEILADMAGHRA